MRNSHNYTVGHRAIRSALLASSYLLFAYSLFSCSLLFSQEEQDGTSVDAATEWDASEVSTNTCGLPILDETLAHYALDEMTPSTRLSAIPSESPKIQSLILMDNVPTDHLHSTVSDGQCHNAAAFEFNESRFLRLGNDDSPDNVRSVDFWFRFTVPDFPPQRSNKNMALVAKDASQTNDGDFRLLLVRESGGEYQIVSRIQRRMGDNEGEAILCSPKVTENTWHHVAYSFGQGTSWSSLFFDGVDLSDNETQKSLALVSNFSILDKCGEDTLSARTTSLVNNDRDWTIGASNHNSSAAFATQFLNGEIDELRFRSTAFDSDDATRIREFIDSQP